jgi:hypothetical protein
MMGSAWTSERELLNKNKYLKLDFSGQAYLTSRNMCQGLEGHQVFENQGGERHLQPARAQKRTLVNSVAKRARHRPMPTKTSPEVLSVCLRMW